MRIITSYRIKTTPEKLWPLLFGSKMDSKKPCYFLMGLPKPIECKIEGNIGGVGQKRQCVSDKGTIQQTILEWVPNKKLVFEMAETNIYFGPCVECIKESFVINPLDEKLVLITRETHFSLSRNKFILSIPMWIGLKSIHRYVFKNWKRLSES